MTFVNVYFGLGSNLGNRLRHIETALERMNAAFGTRYTSLSHVIETDAWGFQGNRFLNACVLYRLYRKGTPEEHGLEILRACKEIEHALGRVEDKATDEAGKRVYHNRPIDIDILFYGLEHIETEELIVPHPLIAKRDFVKIPLREIAKPSLKSAFPELFM